MTVEEIAAILEGEGLGSQLRTEEPGLLYLGDTLIAGTSLAWLEPYYSEYSRKGGHRHNHCSNRRILGYYRSKRLRKVLRRCMAAFLAIFSRRHGGI